MALNDMVVSLLVLWSIYLYSKSPKIEYIDPC